jgi:hypothetical protein
MLYLWSVRYLILKAASLSSQNIEGWRIFLFNSILKFDISILNCDIN